MTAAPVVWAHDLCGSVRCDDEMRLIDWAPVEAVTTVVRYDARGHGSCTAGGYEIPCYRWSAMVDDMLRVSGTGPFIAAGLGMGAVTAVWAAVRAPKRVAGQVLVLPPPAWEDRTAASAGHNADADVVESRGVRALADAWRSRPGPLLRPDLRDCQARHLAAMNRRYLASILRAAALSDLPSPDDVRYAIVPTLILAWEGDEDHPVEVARQLADMLLQPELHVATRPRDVEEWPALIADFAVRAA